MSIEPRSGGEAYKIHEVFRSFIKPREDPAELLEFAINVGIPASLHTAEIPTARHHAPPTTAAYLIFNPDFFSASPIPFSADLSH